MTFTSFSFVLFFAIVAPAYYLCPAKYRYLLLFSASCYFYMAFVPKYILILFFLILVDYIFAQLVEKSSGTKRRLLFLVSIFSNVGILFVFKYFNFFNENMQLLAHAIGWNYPIGYLELLLPLGLSFHIFQSLSYVIEVYRGKCSAEKNLGIYATYVLFFPQLVAGPIERPQHLLVELKKSVRFDMTTVMHGLRIMAWGFFLKLVIADRLAMSVDHVYNNLDSAAGPSIFIVTIFFAFQLYADFYGYSTIARGSAKVLGIDVMHNFDRPYFARSISEFWRRWHISLSTWFRDYFYYPLAHSRKKVTRIWLYVSVVMTFLVTGLWHGAAWTFVVMGLIHGLSIVLGMVTKKGRVNIVNYLGIDKLPYLQEIFQSLMTFVIVSFSWIFFRAQSLDVAILYISKLFTGWWVAWDTMLSQYFLSPYNSLGITRYELVLSMVLIVGLIFVEYLQERWSLNSVIQRQPVLIRTFIYSTLVLLIITLGISGSRQFIYFQF